MYPTLRHLPSLPISLSLPCSVFITIPLFLFTQCYVFCIFLISHTSCTQQSFSTSPFNLYAFNYTLCRQLLFNYLLLSINTGMCLHNSYIGYSFLFIVIILSFISRVSECWRFLVCNKVSSWFCSLLCVRHFDVHSGKYQIKSTSCGLGIYWDNRLFQIEGYSHFYHLYYVVDYLYSHWIARQGNK